MSNGSEEAAGTSSTNSRIQEIGRKKKIRAGHKSHLTKMYAAVDVLLRSYDNTKETELMKLKGSIERKTQVISKLDEEILDAVDDDGIDTEIEAADEIQATIQQKLMEIGKVLEPKVKYELPRSGGESSNASTAEMSGGIGSHYKHMKLPKYEISFDGDPKKYRTFKDLFDVAIKKRADLSNVERFTYLQSFLKGEAATSIEGLAITDENFEEAIAILENRFGNKQLIVNSHMEALVGVPGVYDADDTKGLRELYDKIEIQLRSLRTLDVDPETHGLLVIPILKRKLPNEINLLLSRKFDSSVDLWKIEDMMWELKREVEARERSSADHQDSHDVKDKEKKKLRLLPTIGGLLAAGHLACPYCEKPHFPDKCRIVSDPRRRKEILIQKKRCFLCTKVGHSAASGCQARRMCIKCNGKHHTSICFGKKKDNSSDGGGGHENTAQETQTIVATNGIGEIAPTDAAGTVLLQTACAIFTNPITEKEVTCRMILDNGSQRTYVTRRLQAALKLKVVDKELQGVGVFGGGSVGCKNYDVVMVAVKKLCGKSETLYLRCLVCERICSPLIGQRIDAAREKYDYLRGLDLADEGSGTAVEVEMLVGSDNYWNIVTGDRTIRGTDGPVALRSKLGYILSGPANAVSFVAKCEPEIKTMLINSADEVTTSLQRFWELDSIGILENEMAVQTPPCEIRFSGGRYEVDSPWRVNHELLGDNYGLARSRLLANLKRYKRDDPILLQSYANIFAEQLKDGTLEKVTAEMVAPIGKTYYMPHQVVVRRDKETTNVRVVYDCSSKMAGNISLNDCLEVPEPLYADLLAVLVNFRCHKVAMIGDIEKAFLRIGMAEKDRDAYRVLFVDDPFSEDPNVVVLRFTTVTFGVGPSMWHLGAVIRHHLGRYKEKHPELVKKIERGLYADDFSGGEENDEEAIRHYRQNKKIFKDAGMNMRKWKSNSAAVMEVMREEEIEKGSTTDSHAQMMLNPNDQSPVKVLGIPWDLEDDHLKISLEKAITKSTSGKLTKRAFLSASASIYDPIGAIAPVTFKLKVLFQRLCQSEGSWDEPINEEIQKEWEKWVRSAEHCKVIKFPRCYHPNLTRNSQTTLIGFCDASEKGYAAVVYLRVSTANGENEEVESSLVASKTRVAPLKRQSIPRLELLGAVILARLMVRIRNIIQDVVKVEKEYCFTDSAVAAHWICSSTKRFTRYIDKRADKIRLMVKSERWFHLPGEENIADLPSRGCYPEKLQERKDIWFNGPEWLKKSEESWPVKHVSELQLSESNTNELKREIKKTETGKETVCLSTEAISISNLIDPTRYSSFSKLLRVTSLCLKFIERCKGRKDDDDEISADDISRAKGLWIRDMQKLITQEPKYEKMAESLGIKADGEGYLRCMGRLGRGKIPFDTKHPMILPSHHWVTTLIIRQCHDNVFHNMVKETLAELRSSFWITRGRQRVASVLKRCRLCKLMEGLNYPAPATAEMPEFRVDGSRVFKNAGVDFCGPVFVKQSKEMMKSYIVLFTCATSRMVHLELCPDLTTDAYIRSQKRMMGRRGTPILFVSDNGRTFKGKRLKRFNAVRGIRWRFNLSRAPWWGGMFERLIRSTKRCLRKAIGSRRLTYEELETVLIEVEAVLNSRPITYIYANDIEAPLTPSHLFCGRRLLDTKDVTDADLNEIPATSRKEVVEMARKEGDTVEHFWKRWHREYLVNLREQHKLHKPRDGPKIAVGDIVLIEEEGVKRNGWKLGRVEKTIQGKDGVIRGAEVKTKTGRVARPLQKLYPLEITNEEDGKNVNSVGNANDPKTPSDLDIPLLQSPNISHVPQLTPGGDVTNPQNLQEATTNVTGANGVSTSTATNGNPRNRRRAAILGEEARRR